MTSESPTQPPEWLRDAGNDGDVVISSRVRLARNLAGFPFLTRASESQQREIEAALRGAIVESGCADDVRYHSIPDMPPLRRQILVERRLISRELAQAERPCGVGCAFGERVSMMVNEEDHLRIQALAAGLDVRETWKLVDRVDTAIERRAPYAFHPEFGYLTACPTNLGAGIRVSVMLQLPALAMTGELQKVFTMAGRIDFAVRGIYGESSEALGDFYQISNQKTLGRSEEEIVGKLEAVIPQIARYERRVREALLKEDRLSVEDRVFRAYGILSHARTLDAEEALHLLSHLRLGVDLGLLTQFSLGEINALFLLCQPAHLRAMNGGELDKSRAGNVRAAFLRSSIVRS